MTEQARLDVGETRKPAAIKDQKRVTTGDLAALAMCAHLYEPGDVAGWYTHEPEDVIRQWITSNVSSVIARLSPHCQYTRGELPPLHPADDLWVGEVDTGPEQTKLVTDGGTFDCEECGDETPVGDRRRYLQPDQPDDGEVVSKDLCPQCSVGKPSERLFRASEDQGGEAGE